MKIEFYLRNTTNECSINVHGIVTKDNFDYIS